MTGPIKLEFSGYYKYTAWTAPNDDGLSQFTLTLNSDGTVHGTGKDSGGPFNLSGILINNDLRFIKQYAAQNTTWKYIGTRVAPFDNVYQFAGSWGYPQENKASGEFVFSAVDQSGSSKPHDPVDGQWSGNYFYNSTAHGHPMNLALGVDRDYHVAADAPYHVIGNGSDDAGDFQMKGTIARSDGQVNFIKHYAGWSWKYQGRYDGRGSISGTWADPSSGVASGSFQLTQVPNVTLAHATPIAKRAAHNQSSSSTLESAVQAASVISDGADILTLLNSFAC